MKKRMLALMMALCLCMGLLPTAASAAESDPGILRYLHYLDVADNTVSIMGLKDENYQGPLHIPGKVRLTADYKYSENGDEYTVTDINHWAFYYSARTAKVTSVTIGEGIQEIGTGAFSNCEDLTSITLPESLTKIGSQAFEFCYALERINIPAGVTEIGANVFYTPYEGWYDESDNLIETKSGSLAEISVSGDNVNYASHEGVLYNKDMTELICCPAGKSGDYVIPDGVTEILPAAFTGCEQLTSLTIPASVAKVTGTWQYWYADGDGYPQTINTFPALTSVTVLNPTLEMIDTYDADLDYTRMLFFCDTMYGYNGSTAETYAAEHNIAFVSLGDAPAQPSTPPSAKPVAVTEVSLPKTASVQEGKTKTLTATVKPDDADNKGVYWTSDDTYVVTVDTNGKITGVKAGTAKVTATTVDGGFSAACTVTVTKASSGGGGGAAGGGGGGGSTQPSATPSAKPVIDASKPASENFNDVVKDSWYEAGVTYVVKKGLFNGVAQGQFAPQQNMTRAMLVTVLARLDGQDTTGGATWYAKGTDWAKAQGVSDGTMLDQSVTREQMVTMLYRYAKAAAGAGDLSQFADGATVSAWAREAMAWAVEQGILTGKDGALLDPQGTATRAEVATILQRFVEKK